MNRLYPISGLYLVSLLMTGSLAFAEIRETKSMTEAIEAVDADTLLVFDLDNTVVKPAQMLGTDQWYDHLVKDFKATGDSEDKAINKAIVLWSAVQKVTKVVPVEAVTPRLVERKQKQGVVVMGLTARPIDLIGASAKQLQSIGLDFTKTTVFKRDLTLQSDDIAKFAYGILFVGPKNNKGKVLSQFLKKINKTPKRIVFVDDKSKHVRNMEEAMKDLPTKYLGFRYGAADHDVANFDSEIAKVQLRYFGGILDDESASTLIRTNK